eukprot:754831-Lingulodinium_polyedra.AAC.1
MRIGAPPLKRGGSRTHARRMRPNAETANNGRGAPAQTRGLMDAREAHEAHKGNLQKTAGVPPLNRW